MLGLGLCALSLAYGWGIGSFYIFCHEIFHEVLAETIQRTSAHLLHFIINFLTFLLKHIQRIIYRLLYKLNIAVFLYLFFLFLSLSFCGIHGIRLEFNILLNLFFMILFGDLKMRWF